MIRILTLSVERLALHELGKSRYGTLATMGVGFGGAAVVLWGLAFTQMGRGVPVWIPSAVWTGALYALAFAFYTASLVKGPLSVVSPWSNATVILLWLFHPAPDWLAWISLILFAAGAYILTNHEMTYPVIWMLVSDVLLALARLMDVHHVHQSAIAYSASIFTMIGLWMLVPIVVMGKAPSLIRMIHEEPGWSFVAASSNAAAYMALFVLLRWVHPAAVEAISAVGSSVAAILGVWFYHERHARRKVASAGLMAIGTVLLLYSQYH